jgi:hypothetical protein
MDSEMELASHCPVEIPCQFNHKRVENSVQKGTAPQIKQAAVTMWVCIAIIAEERLSALKFQAPTDIGFMAPAPAHTSYRGDERRGR